jgi:hypothetical protein
MSAFTPTSQHRAPPDPAQAFRVIRIIHLAFCGSVLIYGLLVYLMLAYGTIPEGGFAPDFSNFELFRPILWLIAAGEVVAVWVLRARLLSPEAIRRNVRGSVGQYLNSRHIILFATALSVAIYGLLLFLVAALVQDFLVLAGLSLFLLLALRPRAEQYRDLPHPSAV